MNNIEKIINGLNDGELWSLLAEISEHIGRNKTDINGKTLFWYQLFKKVELEIDKKLIKERLK